MRKHSFNQLLIALCVFDLLFIIVSIPVYSFNLFKIFLGNQVSGSWSITLLLFSVVQWTKKESFFSALVASPSFYWTTWKEGSTLKGTLGHSWCNSFRICVVVASTERNWKAITWGKWHAKQYYYYTTRPFLFIQADSTLFLLHSVTKSYDLRKLKLG